ncbi:MAG: DUF6671 family protein [Pseudomonadota bacterium]
MNQPEKADYAGQRIALLTQHGKERVIAPLFEAALGCEVAHVTGFDTDRLGTFSREIPRPGSQLDAARRKARIGMELSGLAQGLASEGAFGPDPCTGLFAWHVECVLFIDDERDLEIVGLAQGSTNFSHRLVADWADAAAFARQIGFPGHHLLLRPQGMDDARITKDIRDWVAFESAFARAREQAPNGLVFLESDMRAHANPTRMANIARATEDLLMKLRSCCPVCGTPGYGLLERVPGLPCADCGAATREVQAEVYGCLKCGQRERRAVAADRAADPGACDYCNP